MKDPRGREMTAMCQHLHMLGNVWPSVIATFDLVPIKDASLIIKVGKV